MSVLRSLDPETTSLETGSSTHPSPIGEESFADLFAQYEQAGSQHKSKRQTISIGQVLSGPVIRVGKEFLFVDIGQKAEARMSIQDLQHASAPIPEVGQIIRGRVVSIERDGNVLLSQSVTQSIAAHGDLDAIFDAQLPVECVVKSVNKGGLDVDIGGKRGFLPVSHIELRHCHDPASYVGKTLRVLITKYDKESGDVVVSRRTLLEQERREGAERIRGDLVPGKVFLGTVLSVQEFGAFVDLGSVEGFLPVREAGYGRDLRLKDLLHVGEQKEFVLLRVEDVVERGAAQTKITLSLKALLQDPFTGWVANHPEGQRVTGKVVRLEAFGAFVELAPGVEGLIHHSLMTDRPIKHAREALQMGQEVSATVVRIDESQRRIGLSLVEEARLAHEAALSALSLGEMISVVVDKIEPFGVLVRIPGQMGGEDAAPKGLIRNGELGILDKNDIKRKFPVGKELRAMVKKIDPRGKVELSLKDAEMAEEKASVSMFSSSTAGNAKTSLGDLLKKSGVRL